MLTGFELNSTGVNYEGYYEIGKKIYENKKTKVKYNLEKFTSSNSTLNGTQLQENWFPQINADIFISHSHLDEKKAIALAGWLNFNFNLDVFIDSCIWGYSNDLLKTIDDKYCKNTNGTYDYEKSVYAASHIHMMLSTAILKMIDNAESVIFLNTPNLILQIH